MQKKEISIRWGLLIIQIGLILIAVSLPSTQWLNSDKLNYLAGFCSALALTSIILQFTLNFKKEKKQ